MESCPHPGHWGNGIERNSFGRPKLQIHKRERRSKEGPRTVKKFERTTRGMRRRSNKNAHTRKICKPKNKKRFSGRDGFWWIPLFRSFLGVYFLFLWLDAISSFSTPNLHDIPFMMSFPSMTFYFLSSYSLGRRSSFSFPSNWIRAIFSSFMPVHLEWRLGGENQLVERRFFMWYFSFIFPFFG